MKWLSTITKGDEVVVSTPHYSKLETVTGVDKDFIFIRNHKYPKTKRLANIQWKNQPTAVIKKILAVLDETT